MVVTVRHGVPATNLCTKCCSYTGRDAGEAVRAMIELLTRDRYSAQNKFKRLLHRPPTHERNLYFLDRKAGNGEEGKK